MVAVCVAVAVAPAEPEAAPEGVAVCVAVSVAAAWLGTDDVVAVSVAAAEVEAVCAAVCVAVWVDAWVGAEEVVAESVACGVFVLVPVAAADWVPDGDPVDFACAEEEAVAELEQDGTFDIPVEGQPPLRPLHVHRIAAAAPAGQ